MLNFIRRIWLPRTLESLAPWFANFNLKFTQFAAALGLAAHTVSVAKDNAVVQWLLAARGAAEANDAGLRQFRDETLYAGKGDPAPVEPIMTLPEAPDPFTTSIIERLDELVDKIFAADNYTDEIGVQLGIVLPKGEGISPGSVKPTAKGDPAQSGYMFAVTVSNRGEADSADVEIRRAGSETWTVVKTFTGKSVDVTITPTTPGQPEMLQVRIQLKKKNENYGQPSDVVSVTVNP
jgi:hypothetical protein